MNKKVISLIIIGIMFTTGFLYRTPQVTAHDLDESEGEPELGIPCNHFPHADAGGPYWGDCCSPTQLDGSQSYDEDGDVLRYMWDYTNDGTWDTDWLEVPTTEYTYPEPINSNGHYEVALRVRDEHNATSWPDIGDVYINSNVAKSDMILIAGDCFPHIWFTGRWVYFKVQFQIESPGDECLYEYTIDMWINKSGQYYCQQFGNEPFHYRSTVPIKDWEVVEYGGFFSDLKWKTLSPGDYTLVTYMNWGCNSKTVEDDFHVYLL